MVFNKYLDIVCGKLKTIVDTQEDVLDAVASRIVDATRDEHLIHLFGTGHAHMLAEDCFYRAGGFANVDAILYEPLMLHDGAVRSTSLERESGLARRVLNQYPLNRGDLFFAFSNSGINAVPIEGALYAKDKGLIVIAVTSIAHSSASASRHSSGKRLYEVADYVLDNCCDIGDAALDIAENVLVAPTSTICGSFIMQALFAQAAQRMLASGEVLPVYLSANLSGDAEHNAELIKRYKGVLRHL